MNKEETLALWRQGKDAWNVWAKDMLDRRAEMKAGTCAGRESQSDNRIISERLAAMVADFSGHVFDQHADFGGFLFPSLANFDNARFQYSAFDGAKFIENARFSGTRFICYVRFDNSTFMENAWFSDATFSSLAEFSHARFKYADFTGVTFEAEARFVGAVFQGRVHFIQAHFAGYTRFEGAHFERVARFTASQIDRAFSLVRATFDEVPGFVQAHFREAPRLDNVFIPEVGGIARFFFPGLPGIHAAADTSARYRALKGLAIQGHDHVRELDYFASELKARRGHPDQWYPNPLNWFRKERVWPGGARYWFGLGYQITSDFGRSMVLPLIWLALTALVSAWGYLALHFAYVAEHGQAYGLSSIEWIGRWVVSFFAGSPPLLSCVGGSVGEPWNAAWLLSLAKTLPYAGVVPAEKLTEVFSCLYGIPIPSWVVVIGMAQLVLSLVLLFLFLLAVRNHFRIR